MPTPKHIVGQDGSVYQIVPVPSVIPKTGFFPAVGRAINLVVKTTGWIVIGLFTICVILVKRK